MGKRKKELEQVDQQSNHDSQCTPSNNGGVVTQHTTTSVACHSRTLPESNEQPLLGSLVQDLLLLGNNNSNNNNKGKPMIPIKVFRNDTGKLLFIEVQADFDTLFLDKVQRIPIGVLAKAVWPDRTTPW